MLKRKAFLLLRLLFFFFIFAFSLQKSIALPQEKKIKIEKKDISLIELMAEIKEKTTYTFLYNVDDVKKIKKVNLSESPKSVNQILVECLHQTELTYEIRDRVIILKQISDANLSDLNHSKLEQHQPLFKGKVTDINGTALPGVTVLIKDTFTGTSTDINGNFSLAQSSNSDSILVFSYIGMVSREITVEKPEQINVTLFQADEKLGEVIVSTGFQKIDRNLFTGAANKLNLDDVFLNGVADVSRHLQGHVAGVQIDNVSGTFGTSPLVRIRGKASINGSNKPLWVIDGVVQEDILELTNSDLTSGNLATVLSSGVVGINPYDIESYQILKDASATALYGAKAMNGVIVITTKKGQKGKIRVNYYGGVSLRNKPDYSQFDKLNSVEEMDVYEELYEKGWINTVNSIFAANHGALSKMFYEISNNNLEWGADGGLNYQYLSKYSKANTDWFDVLFRNSLLQQHSFTFSGGHDKIRYYSSIGCYYDSGQTVADDVKNYTATFKSDFDISDQLKLGLKLSGNIRDQRLPGSRDRKFESISGIYERNFDINPFNYALYTSRSIRPYDDNGELEYFRRDFAPFNILHELNHNYVNVDVDDFLIQGDTEFSISSKLSFSSILQARMVNTLREQKIHELSNLAESYRADDPLIANSNSFLFDDPEFPEKDPYTVLPQGGFYNTTKNSLISFFIRNQIDWKIKYDQIHSAQLLLGQEIRSTNRSETHNEEWGYLFNNGGITLTDPNVERYLRFRDQEKYYKYKEKYRFFGVFLSGAYSFKGKYILNSTIRYDGDNRQGKNSKSRYLPTWNVSAAWNLHGENFLRAVKFIDRLKLKATYGLSGDNGLGASHSLILRSEKPLRPTSEDAEDIIYIEELANRNLTWEKLYEFNVGIEMEMLKGRIYTDLEFYRRKSKDLLGYVTTSGIGGLSEKYGNVGKMKIDGFEFTLSTNNIKAEKFNWNTRFTFSYGKDKITNYYDKPRIGDAVQSLGVNIEGFSSNSLFSIPFAKLDSKGIPLFYGANGELIQGLNLQNRINILEYLKYEGPTTPKAYGGLDNTLKYHNWTFSVGINYKFGNKIRLDDAFSDSYSDHSGLPGNLKNRWKNPGDQYFKDVPAILSIWDSQDLRTSGLNPYQLYNKSTGRVANGCFIRLKNIGISYEFPEIWLKSIHLKSAKLKFQAYNVGLIYSDKKLNGIDPEFYQSGGISLPLSRTYSFSVNLGF